MSEINKQAPGPATLVDCVDDAIEADGHMIAIATGESYGQWFGNDSDAVYAANRRLLAAAYTAFDAAGRKMGVDAATLAERMPDGELAEVIFALKAMLLGCNQDNSELFPGHTEAYLRTVAIPRAMAILDKLGMAP